VVGNNVNWGVNGIEGDTDLNDLQDTVKKKFDSLAPGLPNIDQLNESIPALDEGEKVLKEKCLKNSQSNNSYELTVVSYLFLLFLFLFIYLRNINRLRYNYKICTTHTKI